MSTTLPECSQALKAAVAEARGMSASTEEEAAFFRDGEEGRYEGGAADPELMALELELAEPEPKVVRTPQQEARRQRFSRGVAFVVGGFAALLAVGLARAPLVSAAPAPQGEEQAAPARVVAAQPQAPAPVRAATQPVAAPEAKAPDVAPAEVAPAEVAEVAPVKLAPEPVESVESVESKAAPSKPAAANKQASAGATPRRATRAAAAPPPPAPVTPEPAPAPAPAGPPPTAAFPPAG